MFCRVFIEGTFNDKQRKTNNFVSMIRLESYESKIHLQNSKSNP